MSEYLISIYMYASILNTQCHMYIYIHVYEYAKKSTMLIFQIDLKCL